MKAEVLMRVSDEPDGSPRLWEVLKILNGEESKATAKLHSLKGISELVGLHPTWLNRLKVHQHCGTQIAGHRRYTEVEVKEYLQSDLCQDRIAELKAMKRLKGKKKGESNCQ